MRRRRRGISLALVLVAMLILAVVLGALLTRTQTARTAARHGMDRAQARYHAMGDLNTVLQKIRGGMAVDEAARQVSAASGRDILVAGNRILVTSETGSFQARLQQRAWEHVLFASALDLNGVKGAFAENDPHRPAVGDPPTPSAAFAEEARAQARTQGIYLAPTPADCVFRPGGGTWTQDSAGFLYLGGGAGSGLGWSAGTYRWTLTGDRWVSSDGMEFQLGSGTWIFRAQKLAEPRLAGPLVSDASLSLQSPLDLQGSLLVWGGYLDIQRAVRVASSDPVAVTVARAGAAGSDLSWERSPLPAAGDLVLATGASRLAVGDLQRPEETGALVLATGRLVKKGALLQVAGVVAARRADLDGVPAGDLVWSGRVGRQAPATLTGTDVGLAVPSEVGER